MEIVPAPKTTPAQALDIFRPVLLRGLAAAVYSLLSIFWIGADEKVFAYCTAGLLVLTGAFMWQYVTVDSAPEKSRGAYALGAGLMMVAGIAEIFVPSPMWVGFVAAFGFLAAGVAELTVFFTLRNDYPPFRNQMISGAVALLLAVALCFGFNLDAHGMFGLLGGGTIILAVFELIAGFGHLHESKPLRTAAGAAGNNENN